MGDRGQVEIISEDSPNLYFYTHWGANSLEYTVADALERGRGRWSDDEYLNRIIFSEMIKDEVLEETGYGIGFGMHGDIWKLVVVNYKDNTVGIKVANYEDNKFSWVWELEPTSFDNFINLHQKVSY
jgi:hypothetical protein